MSSRSFVFAALAVGIVFASGAFPAAARMGGAATTRRPATTAVGGATGTTALSATGTAALGSAGAETLVTPGQNLTTTGMNSLNSVTTTANGGCRIGSGPVPSC